MNRFTTVLFLVSAFVAQQSFAAVRIEGKVFRERKGEVELIVSTTITTNRTPDQVRATGHESVVPGDCISYLIFVKNVSDGPVRVVTSPDCGFRRLGRDFSFSCEPVYFDGGFVRTAASRLDIVELKPGELAPLGTADYFCGSQEAGENTFWYSVSEAIGREYGVWSGSVLCRAPFKLSGTEEGQ